MKYACRQILYELIIVSFFLSSCPAESSELSRGSDLPLESPIGLHLSFTQDSYPRHRLEFSLTLENRSSSDYFIQENDWLDKNVGIEVRDREGYLVDVHKPEAFYFFPISFGRLPAGRSETRQYIWSDRYREPSMTGVYRVRFSYDMTPVNGYARKKKLRAWVGSVVSNTIALDFHKDKVVVLGDWHMALPDVKLACLKPGYKLIKRFEKVTSPSVFPSVFAVNGEQSKRILKPQDLEGLVSITTQESAWSFVRLFTFVDTHYLFDSKIMEVLKRDDWPDELYGVIPADTWAKLKLEPLSIKQEGKDFLIERNLIVYPEHQGGKVTLYRSEERVTSTGKYDHRIKKVILKNAPVDKLGIVLPYY